MLSPAAARMGCVKTTLRKIGLQDRRHVSTGLLSHHRRRGGVMPVVESTPKIKASSTLLSLNYHPRSSPFVASYSDVLHRWKSTMASYGDSDDDTDDDEGIVEDSLSKRSHGHAEGVKARGRMEFSHEEAWMINLGRGNNDEWLLGPRDEDEWFTGLKPSICPGSDSTGIIRSLPLPNLDGVTRQAAQDYFDNSWSLYETLFAGLKGEEGFYR